MTSLVVHIDRSTRTALIHIGRELVEAAVVQQNFVASLFNGGGDFGLDRAQLTVCLCRRLFHHHHTADKLRHVRNFLCGDFKVFNGAQGVDAPIHFGGNLAVAQ